MRLFLLLITLLSFADSNTCLNTYQFKIFPVGMIEDQIVSIDTKIIRAHSNVLKNDDPSMEVIWHLETFISVYDQSQKLISKKLISKKSIEKSYAQQLQKEYEKGIQQIKKQHPKIQLFQPKEISFCEFQNSCKIVQNDYDHEKNTDHLTYRGKQHPITIFKDTSYYGFNNSAFFSDRISGYAISSTRVYTLGNIELVIAHLESGHELSMGWITHDAQKKPKDEHEIVIYKKEYTPNIDFSDIKKSTYEEPLLHHGYGVDLFLVHKNSKK